MRYKLSAFADEAAASLREQISAMTQNGIRYLEIRGVDGKNIADISAAEAKEIRRRLDDSNIAVWSLGSPYGKIGMEDDFDKHLERFKRSLEVADILGTEHIRLFSFYGAAHMDEVLNRLNKFVITAKGSPIILCHENEKGIYGDTAARCLEIHKALPEIKAVFDPANFVQCGQDTKAAWELLGPYVEYMHIKDALPDGVVVPAGKGAGNLAYLLERYRGEVLTIEPHLLLFEGFGELEANEKTKMEKFCYPDSKTAFTVAVNALKDILERQGYDYE